MKREGEKEQGKFDLERRRRRRGEKATLTSLSSLGLILSGVNSLQGWLWNRERLYPHLLQCSSRQNPTSVRWRFERKA